MPPETHLETARYWRIPIHQRLLLGASRDRAEGGSEIAVATSTRYARHKESLTWFGPWTAASQVLFSGTVELRGGKAWSYRIGAGYERSEMPETGEAGARPGLGSEVLHAGLGRKLGDGGKLRLSVSRRSRFPSMREMFSTALGKFHPNNDLGQETQNLLEAEYSLRRSRGEASMGVFSSFLEGGIEKVPYEGPATYQRVNRDEIRVHGLELMLGWRPRPGLHLGFQHSQFSARVRQRGEAEAYAEDRPEYLSRFSLAWTHPGGTRLRLEAAATGPRYSAHPEEGQVRLPAEGSASLRLGHMFRLGRGSDLEIYIRVDNFFDSILLSQIGLPEAGRFFQAGLNLAIRG